MKKSLALLAVIAITLALLYVAWLRAGVIDTEWAIELVGGEKRLAGVATVAAEDLLFLKSIDPKPTAAQAIEILSDRSCPHPEERCLNINLSIANTLAITGQDLPAAKFFVDLYSTVSTESCPLKAEISQLIYQTSYLVSHPDKGAAFSLLNKIKNNGGITNSLATPACNEYLSSRPYFSKAYLFYLATLMALADHFPMSASFYLVFKSDYQNN